VIAANRPAPRVHSEAWSKVTWNSEYSFSDFSASSTVFRINLHVHEQQKQQEQQRSKLWRVLTETQRPPTLARTNQRWQPLRNVTRTPRYKAFAPYSLVHDRVDFSDKASDGASAPHFLPQQAAHLAAFDLRAGKVALETIS